MTQLYQNPQLVDFLQVMSALRADELAQYEAFSGEEFNAQRVAAFMALQTGPRWVVVRGDTPVAVAGFDLIRPGVWQDWMFSTDGAWEPGAWRSVTKHVRKGMTAMLQSGAHRLQCVSLASRVQAHAWYRVLGLRQEGVLRRYGVNGEDAIMFARTE